MDLEDVDADKVTKALMGEEFSLAVEAVEEHTLILDDGIDEYAF